MHFFIYFKHQFNLRGDLWKRQLRALWRCVYLGVTEDNTIPVCSTSSILLMIQEQWNQWRNNHLVICIFLFWNNTLRNSSRQEFIICNSESWRVNIHPKFQSFSIPFFVPFVQLGKPAKNHSEIVHYTIPKYMLYHENSSLLKTQILYQKEKKTFNTPLPLPKIYNLNIVPYSFLCSWHLASEQVLQYLTPIA